MRNNLLYYFPNEADILFNSENEPRENIKRAEKSLSVSLGQILVNGFLCEEDGLPKTLHKKYSGTLRIMFPLAAAFLVCMICIAVGAELPDNSLFGNAMSLIGVVLLIPSAVFWVILAVLMWMLYTYKKKLLACYLEAYTPRCTELSAEFRDELAKSGFDTGHNQSEIEQGQLVPDVMLEELRNSEKYVYLENCVCIACKSRMNCGEISEFDNYTAVCPGCGRKSIIPDLDGDISDELLSSLHEYWYAE